MPAPLMPPPTTSTSQEGGIALEVERPEEGETCTILSVG
jgi:hypothetical protein